MSSADMRPTARSAATDSWEEKKAARGLIAFTGWTCQLTGTVGERDGPDVA